ncbi:hypothetical protein Tco_0246941 [Tanacetum coccineum]
MNVTTGGVEPPFTPNSIKPTGGDAYIFVVGFFCTIVLLISLMYSSYICRRTHSTPPPISFGTTIYDEEDNHHLIRFSRGLDDEVLVTFPTLLYSDVKGDTTANDANGTECSICLADYKPADVVRLSTWHFLKFPENSVEVLKILENKLESMKILENKLESLKLQENQPVDGLVPLSIKKFTSESVFERLLKKNHREEEDQEGNNSPEIETLTYHVLATYG